MSSTTSPIKIPLPKERPTFPGKTGLYDKNGKPVGGRYMPDSIIGAVVDKLEPEFTPQETEVSQDTSQSAVTTGYKTVQTPTMSRTRALGNFAARNIVGAAFGYNSGIYADAARYAPRRQVYNTLVPEEEQTGTIRAGGGLFRGRATNTKVEADISTMSKDISNVKDTNMRVSRDIGIVKDTVLRIEKLLPYGDEKTAKEEKKDGKKDSSIFESLVAAGSALLGVFATLRTGIEGLLTTVGNLSSLLGRTLVSTISSLFNPTGLAGRALLTGARLLFSGPALAAIIGAGALGAIGAAIIRAINMTPEERARLQQQALNQAQAGRENMGVTPGGSPGQAAARGLAGSYEMNTEQIESARDLLEAPESGESDEQKAARERANALFDAATREAATSNAGNPRVPQEVADYLEQRRARETERAAGAQRAIGQSMDEEMNFMRTQQSTEERAAANEAAAARSATRNVDMQGPGRVQGELKDRIDEVGAAMNIPRFNVLGATLNSDNVPISIRTRQGLVPVSPEIIQRFSPQDRTGAAIGRSMDAEMSFMERPQPAEPVDDRSRTITQNANQPNNIIINNQAAPPAAAPAAAAGQQGGGAGNFFSRLFRSAAPALPSQPIRPAEAASPAAR